MVKIFSIKKEEYYVQKVLHRKRDRLDVFKLVKINGTKSGITRVIFFYLQIILWMFLVVFVKQARWIINVGKVKEGKQIHKCFVLWP